MATGQLNGVLQHLRKAMLRDHAGPTDGQLLNDYLNRRDEAALAALVLRHGPMVWGVCRRALSNYHDAEDVFQATFLVLVRRAASIASPELVANWLYGVAHQTALKARATAHKRKAREKQVADMPEPSIVDPNLWSDLQPLVDQELSRLPEIARCVLVLCDLQGKTRKEAAQHLGLPEGTVGSRLARARIMLAKRLAQRGIELSVGALAAVLVPNVAAAAVPDAVMVSTIRAGGLFAAGPSAAVGAIRPKAAALAEGVLKAMMISKFKAAVAVILLLGLIVSGATFLTRSTAAAPCEKPPLGEQPAATPQKPEPAEDRIAWGKEVDGLQAGAGVIDANAIYIGGNATFVVKLRNVGKDAIKVAAWPLWLTPPGVVEAAGRPVRTTRAPMPLFDIVLQEVNVEPGQTVLLAKTNLGVAARGEPPVRVRAGVVDAFTIYVAPGKHQAVFGGFLQSHPTLATGAARFVVKAAQSSGRRPPEGGAPTNVVQKLGIRLTAVGRDAVARVNDQLCGGMRVISVDANSSAAKAGIKAGDMLVGLHIWETVSMENVNFVLDHRDLATFNPVAFMIVRGGAVRKGYLQVPDN